MNVEFLIRISSFALVFTAMAGWEFLAPRRAWAVGRGPRWTNNLGILVVDVLADASSFRPLRWAPRCSRPGVDGDSSISPDFRSRSPRYWAF